MANRTLPESAKEILTICAKNREWQYSRSMREGSAARGVDIGVLTGRNAGREADLFADRGAVCPCRE